MKHLVDLADPDGEDADKLFAFARDMRVDDDRFVRAMVMDLFGRIRRRQGIPFLWEALHDRDEEVRHRAGRALEALEKLPPSPPDSDQHALPASELLRQIRHTRGPHRQFYLQELQGRRDAFDLAQTLLQGSEDDLAMGLQAILGIQGRPAFDGARARKVTTNVLARRASRDDHRAIALRILAASLDGDATQTESEHIAAHFNHRDPFVRLAALSAAGASGSATLARGLLRFFDIADPIAFVTASEAFSRSVSDAHLDLLPELIDALKRIPTALTGRQEVDRDLRQAQAYLFKAMSRLIRQGALARSDLQKEVFEALAHSPLPRATLVASLEVLDAITDRDGLAKDARWESQDAIVLVNLLSTPEEQVRKRVIDLLKRGAPQDLPLLVPHLKMLHQRQAIDPLDELIPLLALARGPEAKALVEKLASDASPALSDAAADLLRRWRNEAPLIDVEFEPSPGHGEED